jgi:dihydrofolate reductase
VADLIYFTSCSLDGYCADEHGDFGFAEPDAEIHRFVNDLHRDVGSFLLGRRDHEVMAVWDTFGTDDQDAAFDDDGSDPEMAAAAADFAAIWKAADKVVYSTTLTSVSTLRSRLEPSFDVEAVRALKDAAAAPMGIGGPTLAGQAIAAGLVDEARFIVYPVLVGGGLSAWPAGVRARFELAEVRPLPGGAVYLSYRTGA